VRVRVYQTLVVVVFAAILLYAGIFLAREYSKIATFVGMGDIWSFVRFPDGAAGVFTEVDPLDFPNPPYPAAGDSLIAVGGLPADWENYFSIFNPRTPPGTIVPITFRSGDELVATTVVTRSIPPTLRFQAVTLFVLRCLMITALILVGFSAFVRRPGSAEVRILAFFCFSLAASMLLTGLAIAEGYAAFDDPIGRTARLLFRAFGFLAPVFWLKFHLVFPKAAAVQRTHPRLLNAALFLPPVALAVWLLARPDDFPRLPMAILRNVYLAAGFFFLIRNTLRAESFLVRRQTWLVLMGAVPGLALYAGYPWVLMVANRLGSEWTTVARLYYFNLTFLLMLLVPTTIALALGRYRLLEVQGRLKRGTRLVAVNVALLGSFLVMLYLFGDLLLNHLGVESRAPTLALGLLLALGFVPAQRRIRRLLEERFYPERRHLRGLLREFLSTPSLAADAPRFWNELVTRLTKGLSACCAFPVLRQGRMAGRPVLGDAAPLPDAELLFQRLEAIDHPVFVDEMLASERIPLEPGQVTWLETRRIALLLPLRTTNGLIGVVLLGCKQDRDDYRPEELEQLRALGAQLALAVENLQLLEDRMERHRLEEQLAVGRQIQEGLLPRKIPVTPGLDVAAKIRFCLDVAGDYYDVIPLANGSTLLAIGDVAGKGVGAALLMASLQATLRAEKHVGMSLPRLMEKINAAVCENTPEHLFITLFVALYEPTSRRLLYVSAGHDRPVLMRRNGRCEQLESSGLLLGVAPGAEYRQRVVTLEQGDTLLMFTDGVTEAASPREEAFGERRLATLAVAAAGRPLPEMLTAIEQAVVDFQLAPRFEDDFTLLAMRVTGLLDATI
jgi:serine phosphatase RsbU (regulator of sigma subunit)